MDLLLTALRAVQTLPPLPSAVLSLVRLLEAPFPAIDDVRCIVMGDPSLSVAVLRAANAAGCAPLQEVTAIDRAVMQLGPRNAGRVALGASFAGFLPNILPGYNITRAAFVQHCVNVGTLAEHICDQLELPTSVQPFTAGLLHDCGKLVLCRLVDLHAARRLLMVPSQSRWVDGERAIMALDHGVLGEALARSWRLPEGIIGVVRWHHEPNNMPVALDQFLSATIHVADELAHRLGGEDRMHDPRVTELLDVTDDELAEVIASAAEDLAHSRSAA